MVNPEFLQHLINACNSPNPPRLGFLDLQGVPMALVQGLVKQGILIPSEKAKSILCQDCGEHPTLEVIERNLGDRYRLYASCPHCGLKEIPEDEVKQWRVQIQGILGIIQASLKMNGSTKVLVNDRLWALDRIEVTGQHLYLGRGLDWQDSEEIFSSNLLGFGVCLGFNIWVKQPTWFPKSICLFPCLQAFDLDESGIRVDSKKILEVMETFKEKSAGDRRDKSGNLMPPKISVSGNVALADKQLNAAWLNYLKNLSTTEKVQTILNETKNLDWSMRQRAEFSNMDSSYFLRVHNKNPS